MSNTLSQSPSAIKTTSQRSSFDIGKSLKSISKLFSKGQAPKTADKQVAQSTQQAEIGKSQAFSNRNGPGVSQSTTQTQSKEASPNNSNSNDIKSTSNTAETPQNGKEIGADLKVPGCQGGCGCGCGK